jgi:methylphosphotriester-DNA--protein-cysteine methyltransferase
MKTHKQLMAAYEKAATAFHKTKPMTAKAAAAAKRMEKAVEALEMWRAAA